MERLNFDSNGRLIAVDKKSLDDFKKEEPSRSHQEDLRDSSSLQFLNESDTPVKKPEVRSPQRVDELRGSSSKSESNLLEKEFWNLYQDGSSIPPLKFSNGKTQEDIVKEIYDLIQKGTKVIFLHGACGTGKSAIALNLARLLGKASIVVPVKALQKQYEEDYLKKKYLLKSSGAKMKIAMITGRENHDSLINPGKSCASPDLPENIKLIERNEAQILEYYQENPLIKNKLPNPSLKQLKRISIAPTNPYWSPIVPLDIELNQLKQAHKISYDGCDGKKYVFYHRKPGCSYYDQFLAYKKADAIIFNAAKYKSELSIGRKPATDIDIIDESDEFLDSLFQQEDINLTRFASSIKQITTDFPEIYEVIDKITSIIDLEEKNKRALGIDENQVFELSDTKIQEILSLIISNPSLQSEIALDELNYSNRIVETALNFKDLFSETYLTYRRDEENNLYASLVSTNLSARFNELINKTKALVFMSGTLHNEEVIKNIFDIKDYKIVEAETLNQGSIEITRTGKEFDCKYSNFKSGFKSRSDYLKALSSCLEKSALPTLIHVNAFQDLPTEEEKYDLSVLNLMSKEKLKALQQEDKTGRLVSLFKEGLADTLFTTKCSRGVDFPGDTCKSIIFTKYPNPNVQNTFWKILQKTHPNAYWDCYKDKANREFLQRIYRAVRSKDDHVQILSPDTRVLDKVREIQLENLQN